MRPADLPAETPSPFSVLRFCEIVTDATTGDRTLSEWVPFSYVERADTTLYTVQDGDTLYTLAARAYAPLGSSVAPRLARVIAAFQPAPIYDMTIKLERGATLYIPSLEVVETEIFSSARARDYEA